MTRDARDGQACGDGRQRQDVYRVKDGKRLRLGYTTGTCAAAAAKAAAVLLLTGQRMERVGLQTPGGIFWELEVRELVETPDGVRCAVQKDGGDDPDVTNGAWIVATVSRTAEPGIAIDGGEGVGRVTKPGLDQPVGAAAINSVPRRMIRETVAEVCRLADASGGLSVVISVPGGAALAEQTFNPRLGITGGISILGTSGIVEPMSDQALADTIRLELRQRRAEGAEYALLTPGNYGLSYIAQELKLDPGRAVRVSNFIGDAVSDCRELGYRGALLVGHIGKLVKLAGGSSNTHSRYGDCRMEILAAYAGAAGLSPQGMGAVLDAATCDGALELLRESGTLPETLDRLGGRISATLARWGGETMVTGAIVFSNVFGFLCATEQAGQLLSRFR